MKDLLWKVPCVGSLALLYVVPLWHAGYWSLAYVSLVPWLVAILHRPGRTELVLSFVAWWIWGVLAVSWLSAFGKTSWVVAPFFYVIPFFFMGWALRRVRQALKLPLCVAFPILFTAAEWLRIAVSPGKLTLAIAGYSQVKLTKLAQIVDVTGVWGLGFFLMAWNGWFADQALFWLERRGGWKTWLRSAALPGGVLVAVTLGILAYGFVRDTDKYFRPGPTLAVVQPNVPHFHPSKKAENRRSYDLQVVYTLSKVPHGTADLVLWPENSIVDGIEMSGRIVPEYAEDLKFVTSSLGMGLLVDTRECPKGENGACYHTAYSISAEGQVLGKSRKVYLLPWTEYAPFARALDWVFLGNAFRRFLGKTVGGVPVGMPGRLEDIRLFEVEGKEGTTRFGVPICFESATPSVARKMARDGAAFLVNPSSEGLLGKRCYRQTLIINMFRAVENRTPVVRATNSGISVFIDANGRIRSTLRGYITGAVSDEPGVLIDRVMLDARSGTTLYTRFGDWLAYLSLALSFALVTATEVRLRYFPPGRPRPSKEAEVPAEWFGLGQRKKRSG